MTGYSQQRGPHWPSPRKPLHAPRCWSTSWTHWWCNNLCVFQHASSEKRHHSPTLLQRGRSFQSGRQERRKNITANTAENIHSQTRRSSILQMFRSAIFSAYNQESKNQSMPQQSDRMSDCSPCLLTVGWDTALSELVCPVGQTVCWSACSGCHRARPRTGPPSPAPQWPGWRRRMWSRCRCTPGQSRYPWAGKMKYHSQQIEKK